MTGFNIQGKTAGHYANVDGLNNLQITTPSALSSGFLAVQSQVDAGDITEKTLLQEARVSEDYRLRLGIDTILFNENFASTTLNTSIWTSPVTTSTIAISGGYCILNNNASKAANAVSRIQTYKQFPLIGTYGIWFEWVATVVQRPIQGNVTEMGVGFAATTATPTDGLFFRIGAGGDLRCIVNYGGLEHTSHSLDFDSIIGAGNQHHYIILLTNAMLEFWVDDILIFGFARHTFSAAMTSSATLPFFARVYNATLTGQAQQLKIGSVAVSLADMQASKPYSHIEAGGGMMAFQGPSGFTVGQTARFGISANPGAASPTINAASLGSGLGGVFLANIPSLSTENNYIISSYQVPAGTATAQGKTLYITGIKFDSYNMGAANSGSVPLTFAVGVNYGATQVDPANGVTGETSSAKIARMLVIGVQSYAVSAVVGTMGSPTVFASFLEGPIVVNQGEFIQTWIRFISYASTTSQALWCYVTFTGYWE